MPTPAVALKLKQFRRRFGITASRVVVRSHLPWQWFMLAALALLLDVYKRQGQKQIWFLLRLVGRDNDVSLRATKKPEFDAWRWHNYWIPLDAVIEFKRGVYEHALNELVRFVDFDRRGKAVRASMSSSEPDLATPEEGKSDVVPG